MIERVAITGCSGHYGRTLAAHLRRELPQVRLLGFDVLPQPAPVVDEFHQMDVRDPALRGVLEEFRPDTVLHFAFVLNPIRDDALMHDINVGGAQNVFDAVRAIRPQRFLMSSSATAYGAWPDNPIPLTEESPIRAETKFRYARDKALLEERIRALANELPEIAVSWTRPTVIAADVRNNVATRTLLRSPFIALPNGYDVPLQLVHEQDLVGATFEILKRDARGPFNIAPPDHFCLSDVAEVTGLRKVNLPAWLIKLGVGIGWTLRLSKFKFPPSMCRFFRYSWVIAPQRLQQELGFRFRYSAKETLRQLWQVELANKVKDEEERQRQRTATNHTKAQA